MNNEVFSYADGVELESIHRILGSLNHSIRKVMNDAMLGTNTLVDRLKYFKRVAKDLRECADRIENIYAENNT